MNKYLIIPNVKELTKFKAKSFNSFILPLENYSIGFDVYFKAEEINEYATNNDIYVIINKFLHKKELLNIEEELKKIDIDRIKGIFIEDIGLTSFLPKNKIVIYQNHMINNYNAINYYNNLGYENIVINNALTIEEINEIRTNTKSKLFYFYISKDMLMYSKRKLISNYFKHYNKNNEKFKYLIKEDISNKELIVSEENNSTTISNNDIFCANKYMNEIEKLDYLVINLTNIIDSDEQIILDNYNSKDLVNMIKCDYYFLEEEIKYKVGDIK